MGNNLKTFEEYKYFKVGSGIYNRKDPNEPFFNKDKSEYKNKAKILSLFNLTVQEWNDFMNNLKQRNFYTSDIYNEKGSDGYNPDYQYYYIPLSWGENDNSSLYLLPYKKNVTVIWGNTKKIFKYDYKPNLNEILDYLYTLKKDPNEEKIRRDAESEKQRQKFLNYITSEDEEDKGRKNKKNKKNIREGKEPKSYDLIMKAYNKYYLSSDDGLTQIDPNLKNKKNKKNIREGKEKGNNKIVTSPKPEVYPAPQQRRR